MVLLTAMSHLIGLIVDASVSFDLGIHHNIAGAGGRDSYAAWIGDEHVYVESHGWDNPSVQGWDKRAAQWVLGSNRSGVPTDEWRQSARLLGNGHLQDMQDIQNIVIAATSRCAPSMPFHVALVKLS